MESKGWVALCVTICIIFAAAFLINGPIAGKENVQNHTELIKIEEYDNLYYDPRTKIVYILFSESYMNQGYGYMSGYYAPNGKPYTFDTFSHELVEIP